MRHNGWTPKQDALGRVLTEIQSEVRRIEAFGIDETPPAFTREVLRHLCKMHNAMLDASNLDGLHIEPRHEKTSKREQEQARQAARDGEALIGNARES
jgi:hypothetical protein